MKNHVPFQHFVSQLHQLPGAAQCQIRIEEFVSLLSETDLQESVTAAEVEALKSGKIFFKDQGLRFSEHASPLQAEIAFDFDEDPSYSRSNMRGKNDLLLKAIGFKNHPLRVLDLTAGLLRDSVFMSQAGCQVTSLERNFLLYLCLAWGLMLAQADFTRNLNLLYRSASDFLRTRNLLYYDVIYYDPMYPEMKSTALPKKEIQFLRELIGEDTDRDETLELILKSNIKSRVVVKKHPAEKKNLKKLKEFPPANQQLISFEGKAVLFEVYIPIVKT